MGAWRLRSWIYIPLPGRRGDISVEYEHQRCVKHNCSTNLDGFIAFVRNETARLKRHFRAPLCEVTFSRGKRRRTRENVKMLRLSTLRLLLNVFNGSNVLQFTDVGAAEGYEHFGSMLSVTLLQLVVVVIQGRVDMAAISATSYP